MTEPENLPDKEAEPPLKQVYFCLAVDHPDVLAELRRAGSHLGNETKADYHLTLRFIHRLAKPDLPRLIEAAERICAGCSPFDLTLSAPGSFPGVAWYGVEPSAPLMALRAEIDQAVLDLGYPSADFDGYNPHITLARVDDCPAIVPVPDKTWTAGALEFRQSKPGGGHRPLQRFAF